MAELEAKLSAVEAEKQTADRQKAELEDQLKALQQEVSVFYI